MHLGGQGVNHLGDTPSLHHPRYSRAWQPDHPGFPSDMPQVSRTSGVPAVVGPLPADPALADLHAPAKPIPCCSG